MQAIISTYQTEQLQVEQNKNKNKNKNKKNQPRLSGYGLQRLLDVLSQKEKPMALFPSVLLPPSQNICRSRFPRNNFNKIYIKKYYYLCYIINIIGKIFESSFLTNLFEDTNIAHILYKLS